MAPLLAILSAIFFALTNLLMRIGLRFSDPLSAIFINMITCFLASIIISVFAAPPILYEPLGLSYFVAVGVIGAFLGRFMLYIGINRVGTSIASPISEVKPLVSICFAVMLLGEELTFSVCIGSLLIVVGAVVISSSRTGGQIEKRRFLKDLIFPFTAAACFGLAHVFRKLGLNLYPSPIVGVAVQNAAALGAVPLVVLVIRGKKRTDVSNLKSWGIFSLAGISNLMSQFALFWALSIGQVVIISPLSSLSPLFLLIMVHLFLQKVEKVTFKIAFGTLLLILGSFLIAVRS